MNTEGCLNCGIPTGLFKRSLKPKKYCSNRCANRYWHSRQPSTAKPGYGEKTKIRLEAKRKRKKELDWYKENWLTATQIGKILGMTANAVHQRAKALNVPGKGVFYKGKIIFWSPESVEKLKYKETPIPEEYLTRKQAAEYVGYNFNYFEQLLHEYGHPEYTLWKQTHGHKATRYLYTKKDLDVWMSNIKQIREEKNALRIEKQKQRKQEKLQKQLEKQLEFEKQIEGLIKSEQAAQILGLKYLTGHCKRNMSSQRIRGRLYFKPEDIEAYKSKRLKLEEERARNKRPKIIHRTTDWTSPKEHEKRVLQKIKDNRLPKKTSKGSVWVNIVFNGLWTQGIITKLKCRTCSEKKPFYDYHVRWDMLRGRDVHCKACKQIRQQSRPAAPEKLTTKLRRIVGVSIKQHISETRNSYAEDIGNKQIWEKLKEHCGYDQHDLKEHLESKFTDSMTWDSWGRVDKAKREGFSWNIDHIIPHSTFPYASWDDENFKECWSLDNLRPMGAIVNSVRGDRDLAASMMSSFRRGLRCPDTKAGIWSELPYSPKEVIEHLKSQFTESMNWDNYGTYWNVDHVKPQAALPYNSMQEPNFKECWAIENLRPMTRSANSTKGSKHENTTWLYNDSQPVAP